MPSSTLHFLIYFHYLFLFSALTVTSLTSAARVAVSVLVACSYPLQCVPSRNCALSLWKTYAKDDYVSDETASKRHNIFTVI